MREIVGARIVNGKRNRAAFARRIAFVISNHGE
jgi:hypothetical protein